MFKNTIYLCILTAAAIISMGPQAMAIEKPSYNLMAIEGNFELRKYSAYIVAETYVEGDFEAVGSEGFRRLADYIGGKNRYMDHETKLMDWISTKGWEIIGAPVWARYDPPFMPWFMRRNEILIPVQIQ